MLADLLTPRRTAIVLGIRTKRVEKLVNSGQLPAVEVDGEIRITEADLAEFIRTRPRVNAPEPICG